MNKYFTDLSTFEKTVNDTDCFSFTIELINGTNITSSYMPIDQMSTIIDLVESTEPGQSLAENTYKGAIVPIWCTKEKKLNLVPIKNILYISINLHDKKN